MKGAAQAQGKSYHGAELLRLLSEHTIALSRQERILTLIREDPLAGRLKSKESGNTAFHCLLRADFPDSFVLPVLKALIETTPSGVKVTTLRSLLPIHIAAMRPNSCGTSSSSIELIRCLIEAYPEGLMASTLSPLIVYLQRKEIANSGIVEAMCSNCESVAKAIDALGNTPLHCAVNKSIVEAMAQMNIENVAHHPENIKCIKILLDANPKAASTFNIQMCAPLHILCSHSTDLPAIKLLYSYAPEVVETSDIYNKTLLHHATLAVGKCQMDAVSREERELQALADMKLAEKNKHKGSKGGMSKDEREAYKQMQNEEAALRDDEDGEEEYDLGIWEEQEYSAKGGANAFNENLGVNRNVVSWLVEQWPEGLVRHNNFGSTPVETVLEKTKPERTKKKIVSVYGLYDDPPTARMLLLAHARLFRVAVETRKSVSSSETAQNYRKKPNGELELDQYGNAIKLFRMPPLPQRHTRALAELNYYARREALLVSYAGQPYPAAEGSGARGIEEETGKKAEKKKKGRHLPQNKAKAKAKAIAVLQKDNGVIVKCNLLARLRDQGHFYSMQNIIMFL